MSQEEVAVDFSSKTVAELKKECKARNLKMSGVKSDLIERLETFVAENGADATGDILEEDLLDEPEEAVEEKATEEPAEEEVPEADQLDINPEPVEDMTQKKLSRAERFGVEIAPEVVNVKKDQRAARFGLTEESNGKESKEANGNNAEVDEKKRARAARFGIEETTATKKSGKKPKLEGMDVAVDDEKLKKRSERFGAVVADDKKQARAARFAAK